LDKSSKSSNVGKCKTSNGGSSEKRKRYCSKRIPAKELTIDGKTITVTYVEMNGKVRISNAWVNY
jgi:hypothetical protein